MVSLQVPFPRPVCRSGWDLTRVSLNLLSDQGRAAQDPFFGRWAIDEQCVLFLKVLPLSTE